MKNPVKRFDGACEVPNLHWVRVGTAWVGMVPVADF